MLRPVLCAVLLAAFTTTAQPLLDCEDPAERARIQLWLSRVEAFLRERPVPHLTPEQRGRRAQHLQHLHAYWRAGRFPHNHSVPGLTPVFIDEHGTACAVGQLLIEGGAAELARRIARDHLLARLPELDSQELERWAMENGFTLQELALIQPSYELDHPEREYSLCFREAPTLLRYEGGWHPVRGPLDRLDPERRASDEFPWLLPGEDDELWLVSRAGAVQVWNGREFEERLPAVQERQAFAMAALPASKNEVMLTLAVSRDQPIPFLVHAGPEGVKAPEKLEGAPLPEIYSLWRDRGVGTVFGVGRAGAIIRRTPYESWVALSSPTKAPLLAMDGTSETDLWAVGGAGVTLHFDGTQWRRVETGTQEGLIAVKAAAKDDVWAVGARGTVLHFDGAAWRPVETGVSKTLRAVAVHGGEVWLGGDDGLILRRRGEGWRREDAPTPAAITSFGEAGGALFAATNAQTPCLVSLKASRIYQLVGPTEGEPAPVVAKAMLPAGVLMASVRAIQEAASKIRWLQSIPLRVPSMLTCALFLAVTPLGLLIVAMRGRRWRRAHKVLGLSLAASGAWQLGVVLISLNAPALYFEFTRGSNDRSLQATELARTQDWVLLEYDLALASAKSEAPQLPSDPWTLDGRFLWSQGELTSPHNLELFERYKRIRALAPYYSPVTYLSECARFPEPPQLRYARCAPGTDSSWLHRSQR